MHLIFCNQILQLWQLSFLQVILSLKNLIASSSLLTPIPHQCMIMGSTTGLVLLLPVELIYLSQYSSIDNDFIKELMEFKGELSRNRYGIFSAQSPNVVRRWTSLTFNKYSYVGRVILCTTECEEECRRAVFGNHAFQLASSQVRVLVCATKRLQHFAQV